MQYALGDFFIMSERLSSIGYIELDKCSLDVQLLGGIFSAITMYKKVVSFQKANEHR